MNDIVENYDVLPFGGLFGDTHLARILEQIIADPFEEYTLKTLAELAEVSSPTVRKDLKHLTSLGILIKDSRDRQHPVYRVNTSCKRYLALTFLAYAVTDDRIGTSCMDDVIASYYDSVLRDRYEHHDAVGNYHRTLESASNDSELSLDSFRATGCFEEESVPEPFAASA